MAERLPYVAPAEPVVVGAVEAAAASYSGGLGSDGLSFYSSLIT